MAPPAVPRRQSPCNEEFAYEPQPSYSSSCFEKEHYNSREIARRNVNFPAVSYLFRLSSQMVEFVNGALGENGVACTTEAPGSGDNNCQGKRHGNEGKESDERWWSQLCANKHLTEDENFKRVRNTKKKRNYNVDHWCHAPCNRGSMCAPLG